MRLRTPKSSEVYGRTLSDGKLHVCWGSVHGPHKHDLPLREIVDLVLKVPAGCYSIEAANPRHEHEWAICEGVTLPDGRTLMPGVVSHASDVVEHLELVKQRLDRFIRLVSVLRGLCVRPPLRPSSRAMSDTFMA